MLFFFFFQAEDGIRDYKVTGVQTCALPISSAIAGVSTSASSSVPYRSSARASPATDPGTATDRWPYSFAACSTRGHAKSPSEIPRSEEHTSELQSPCNLVCRLLLEKKKKHMTHWMRL